jgi:hypothetical protein
MQTDGRTDMTNEIVGFRNFAKQSKMKSLLIKMELLHILFSINCFISLSFVNKVVIIILQLVLVSRNFSECIMGNLSECISCFLWIFENMVCCQQKQTAFCIKEGRTVGARNQFTVTTNNNGTDYEMP